MAKHIVKATWQGGQMRLSIPKLAIRALGWQSAWYMLLEEKNRVTLVIRRFADGESLKGDNKRSVPGRDR